MKSKNIITVLLIAFIMASCAPAVKVVPTETIVPTSTFTPIPPTFTPVPSATPTETPIPPLESQSVTQESVSQFASAMQKVGINITAEQILQQGLLIQTITGTDGKQYEIATTHTDPDPSKKGESLEGDYPLMIKMDNGEWKRQTITYMLASQGIKFGFTYDWKGNKYRKIVIPPDSLVINNSKIVSPEDSFYLPFIFETPTRTSWKPVDEYLSFIEKNKIESASPILVYWLIVSNWLLESEKQHPDKTEARQFFSDILYNQTFEVVTHCKESIHGWTVNELFNENGTFRDVLWLRTIGRDFPEIAIKAIRDADPNAKITINEYGLEYMSAKDSAFYQYVKELKDKGILKDGDVIGIQGHNGIAFDKTTEHIQEVAQKYIDLGLAVHFTELDVFDVKDQKKETLVRKASVFNKFISAALNLNKSNGRNVVDSIIVWGTTNNSSWSRDQNIEGTFPLLLNDDGTPELTYYLVSANILKEITGE